MKNKGKYIVGFIAVALFVYLDFMGKDTYASQLFGALMGVFGMAFGIDQAPKTITESVKKGEDLLGKLLAPKD